MQDRQEQCDKVRGETLSIYLRGKIDCPQDGHTPRLLPFPRRVGEHDAGAGARQPQPRHPGHHRDPHPGAARPARHQHRVQPGQDRRAQHQVREPDQARQVSSALQF